LALKEVRSRNKAGTKQEQSRDKAGTKQGQSRNKAAVLGTKNKAAVGTKQQAQRTKQQTTESEEVCFVRSRNKAADRRIRRGLLGTKEPN
jgi:hypothetical protein